MLERHVLNLEEIKETFKQIGPAGVTFVLNIKFLTPEYSFTTYTENWVKEYSKWGYILRDPVILWATANVGSIRWSEIGTPYSLLGKRVMENAKKHDLNFGAVVSDKMRDEHGRKCFVSVARSDREVSIEELTSSPA